MTMFVDADPLAHSAVAAHRYTQAQAPAQAQGLERRQEQEQEPSPQSSHSPSDGVQSPVKPPDESPKKRKRTRKAATGKKFECKHKGCGKSYSRAEHLSRHQLNRTYLCLRIPLYMFGGLWLLVDVEVEAAELTS